MTYPFAKTVALIAVGVLGLSACGGGNTGTANSSYTKSGFAAADAAGTLPVTVHTQYQYGNVSSGTGNGGYAYILGFHDEDGVIGFSGVKAGTNVGTAPVSGTATMTGSYEAGYASNLVRSGNLVTGTYAASAGTITLAADFGAGTLTGTSDNTLLNVNGTISSSQLGGTVSFDGGSGTLGGVIGATEAIGVFHGNGSYNGANLQTYAGGFIVCTSGTGC